MVPTAAGSPSTAAVPTSVAVAAWVAVPTWPAPVIPWPIRHNDGRRHNYRGRGCAKRRHHHDRSGLADNHARQRYPEPDAHTDTGLRGRSGPE